MPQTIEKLVKEAEGLAKDGKRIDFDSARSYLLWFRLKQKRALENCLKP
jgi:hypothetical protein